MSNKPPETNRMTLSERIYKNKNYKKAVKKFEAALKDKGVQFTETSYDSYDNSMELYGVPPDYRLTPEVVDFILKDEGFGIAFVNHTDGWETHYTHKYPNGWRVSHPHKRRDLGLGEDSAIWVEERPASWPKEWNVVVKKP